MVFWEKGFGGEDEVELLIEPWRYGLLERFEGLVLLGLGPPAMLSFEMIECGCGRRGDGGNGGDKECGGSGGEACGVMRRGVNASQTREDAGRML
jgi:hypothetical protein